MDTLKKQSRLHTHRSRNLAEKAKVNNKNTKPDILKRNSHSGVNFEMDVPSQETTYSLIKPQN